MAPDAVRRSQIRNRRRLMASWLLCVMQAIVGILHLYPPLAYRVNNATTTRVVAWVNSIGGLWFFILGGTALALALTLVIWEKFKSYAHLVCAASAIAYDVQLWVGALGDKPHGPITLPVTFILFFVGHLLLFFSYDGGD